MDYSVILPAYNEASNIGRSIDSIKVAAQQAEIAYEIIVVDNCSTDDTVNIARNHGAVVLQDACGQRHTIAHLRNTGAASAKGRILAFLDSDMSVPENWFIAAERIFNAGFTGLLGFAETVPEDAGWVAKAWGDMRFPVATREVDFIDGRNMLIPRQLFVEVGGFDDSLVTCEDKEFGIRVKSRGWPVLRSPEAVLVHWGYERNLWEFVRKEFWRQGSSLYMMNRLGLTMRTVRHPLLSLYHLMIPLFLIVMFVNGWHQFSICAVLLWILPSIIITFKKAITGKSNALAFWFLTFLRWNISGLALLKQLLMSVGIVKKNSIFFEFICKALRKITRLFIVFRTDDVVRLNLHNFVLPSSLIADCLSSIVQMKADKLASIAACFGEERARKIHERLATSQCFLLYNDSKIVGWAWATALPRPREGDRGFFYPVVPLADHVYLYDVYILPQARGKGLGYKLIACSCMKLAEQGYHFVFFTHDHENIAMNRITRLLNFEKLGELYYRRILWHKVINITALNFVCNPSEKI